MTDKKVPVTRRVGTPAGGYGLAVWPDACNRLWQSVEMMALAMFSARLQDEERALQTMMALAGGVGPAVIYVNSDGEEIGFYLDVDSLP